MLKKYALSTMLLSLTKQIAPNGNVLGSEFERCWIRILCRDITLKGRLRSTTVLPDKWMNIKFQFIIQWHQALW